jgi:hypothetical protein
MDWLAGRVEPPEALKGDVLDLMINFKNTLLDN